MNKLVAIRYMHRVTVDMPMCALTAEIIQVHCVNP